MSYGIVQINGKTYAEREQSFPLEVGVSTAFQVQKISLQLPGTADFWLKSLTRDSLAGISTIPPGPSGPSVPRRFKFRLGNTDGATWYQAGGIGGTTDRVIDTLLFGNAQFPFVLCPYIYYSSSASIQTETEDLAGPALVPYTIYFNFRGSYLVPTQA